jgi:fused signal recognition particle receptor
MGLFSNIKNIFSKKKEIEETSVEEEKVIEEVKKEDKKEEVKEIQEEKELIEKYDKGLEKSRKEFVSQLSLLGIKYNKVSDEYFEELEQLLINADIGVNTVFDFIERLKKRVKSENIIDTTYLNEVIVDELFIIYVNNESLSDKINMASEGPTVILMVGVNGVGKTTTIAKLANKYKKQGKRL